MIPNYFNDYLLKIHMKIIHCTVYYGTPNGVLGKRNGHPFFYQDGIPDGILINATKIALDYATPMGLILDPRTVILLHGWNP